MVDRFYEMAGSRKELEPRVSGTKRGSLVTGLLSPTVKIRRRSETGRVYF